MRAMDSLAVLAKEPHMANSVRNLQLRTWLSDKLIALQKYGSERGHIEELSLQDPVNIIVGRELLAVVQLLRALAKLAHSRGVRNLDCRVIPNRCIYLGAPAPEIRDARSTDEVLGWDRVLQIKFDPVEEVEGFRVLRGVFTGPPGSTTCTVRITTYDGQPDNQFSLSLDSRDGSKWVHEVEKGKEEGMDTSKSHPGGHAENVSDERTLRARRFTDPAAQTLTGGFAKTFSAAKRRPKVAVACRLDETGVSRARKIIDGIVVSDWLGWYGWALNDGGLTVLNEQG
ncbi:hypothetical protein HDU86_002819 [Geranomyces michiganensis]|nr:hypothetical protein HDU86_002819 [Geranomyces michiganensis]